MKSPCWRWYSKFVKTIAKKPTVQFFFHLWNYKSHIHFFLLKKCKTNAFSPECNTLKYQTWRRPICALHVLLSNSKLSPFNSLWNWRYLTQKKCMGLSHALTYEACSHITLLLRHLHQILYIKTPARGRHSTRAPGLSSRQTGNDGEGATAELQQQQQQHGGE